MKSALILSISEAIVLIRSPTSLAKCSPAVIPASSIALISEASLFSDLVKMGHVYILETPLFRVRNKKKTFYCYDDDERNKAVEELGKNPEITRFKGLGEISPSEFKNFIGDDIRLEPIILNRKSKINDLLSFYMGKNTQERQEFIIDKLRVEKDLIDIEE